MHAALHICMSSRPMCKAPCLCAKSSACMQRGVFMMCSSACICARRSVHLQIPLHVCTTACLLAAGLACMHGGVFMCKGPCIGAERRAGLHASVLLCRAACLFCTSTCTRARFTRSLSGQIGKLNLASGAVVQFTFTDAGELQKIRTRGGKKRVNGISFGNSRIYCAMPKFSGRFSD